MSGRRLLTDDEGGGDDSRRLLGLEGPGRDLSDDGLVDLIREAYAVMEPVPQRVYDQAYAAFGAAHELRQGGIPVTALPDQTPGGAVVLDDHAALPGHQTAPGSPGRDDAERRGRGQVMGLERPHDVTQRPGLARLKRLARWLAHRT